jgi:UDP-N-acetylmuramyl pentapeptide phosphotransferase/UDP-N-acetylglucosamine-1-phosphate transferase
MLLLVIVTFLISFISTGLIIRYRHLHLALTGDHDQRGAQKFHQIIVPRIGGLAILISFIFAIFFNQLQPIKFLHSLTDITIAALPIFFAGIGEDITKNINIKFRLMCAFISAIFFLQFFSINQLRFDIILIDPFIQYPWIALLFFSIAIAGLSNAYNIIDGFNGLASMVGIITMIAILYTAFKVQDAFVMYLCIITIGSILGFFIWNYPRGLIFLGDCGAYLIGYLVAVTSILLVVRNQTVSPWFALLVNAYPVFETLFTIWRRRIHQGKNPSIADGAHFHSLIYRRMIRWAYKDHIHPEYMKNAKTSPYLWALTSIAVIPAILWWSSSWKLIIASICYITLYVFLYYKIVNFKILKLNKFKLF